jgi:hypothetical protein
MIFEADCKGNVVTGLRLGRESEGALFGTRPGVIELELDHLRIACGLPAGFWNGEGLIRDRRLCNWLELKRQREGGAGALAVMLTPASDNAFHVKPVFEREAA